MLSDGGKADVAALRKSNCVRPARHSRRITAGGAAWRSFRRPSRATAAISTVDGVRGPCTGCRGRRTAGTGAPLPPPGLTTAAATPVPAELPRWGRLRRVRRPRWAVSGDGLLHMADEVNDHGVEWAALLAGRQVLVSTGVMGVSAPDGVACQHVVATLALGSDTVGAKRARARELLLKASGFVAKATWPKFKDFLGVNIGTPDVPDWRPLGVGTQPSRRNLLGQAQSVEGIGHQRATRSTPPQRWQDDPESTAQRGRSGGGRVAARPARSPQAARTSKSKRRAANGAGAAAQAPAPSVAPKPQRSPRQNRRGTGKRRAVVSTAAADTSPSEPAPQPAPEPALKPARSPRPAQDKSKRRAASAAAAAPAPALAPEWQQAMDVCRLVAAGDGPRLVTVGGAAAVTAAMRAHPGVAAVQEWGCKAAHNLTVSREGQAALLAAGSAEAVVAALQAHVSVAAVQEWGCWTAFGLVVHSAEGQAAVLAAGGAEAVVGALRAHVGEAAVQKQGCAAAWSLAGAHRMAVSAKGRAALLAAGGAEGRRECIVVCARTAVIHTRFHEFFHR
eukprot:COSAG01_NODE_9020_length_2580_cov_46.873438_2_plen_562_part_00